MKFQFALVAAVSLGTLSFSDQAKAFDLLDFGTTYTIEGTGFTGLGSANANFTDTVLLSTSAQTFDNGMLQITENTTGEFAEFYIRTVSGSPLVDPSTDTVANSVFFSIKLSGIRLKVAAITDPADAGYWNFTTRDHLYAGITTSPGISLFGVEANPNTGSIGFGKSAFYCTICTASAPATTTGYNQGQEPFITVINDLHIDPNSNGYFLGLKLTMPPNYPHIPPRICVGTKCQ